MTEDSSADFKGAVSVEAAESTSEMSLYEALVVSETQIEKLPGLRGFERYSLTGYDPDVLSRVTEPLPEGIMHMVSHQSGYKTSWSEKPTVVVFEVFGREGLEDYMGERAARPVLDMLELLDRRLASNTHDNMDVDVEAGLSDDVADDAAFTR